MSDASVTVNVPGNDLMAGLLGHRDELLRLVEAAFPGARIHVRGNEIAIDGDDSDEVSKVFEELVLLADRGQPLEAESVRRAIDMVRHDERPSELMATEILRSSRGRSIRARTAGQRRYIEAIGANVITFGIGPAGTGKSWLAVAMAVQALHRKEVERIILTRPAVEAGERLGFLPGDLMAKIDPYLRPLYDALYDMVEPEGAQRLLDRNLVEVAPLAFMRGRTLNASFIILDEAQNTTPEQMKMFLTRIGFGSRVVITGDVSQVDMPGGRSGLDGLERTLAGIDGLGFVHLGSRDVVRHRIVAGHRERLRAGGFVNPSDRISVFCADEQAAAPVDVRRFSDLARDVLVTEGIRIPAELNLFFVDEAAIAELNERFLDATGPTDVLAFPIDGDPAERGRWPDSGTSGPDRAPAADEVPLLLGDIVVCPAVAERQAPDHAGRYDDELALLVVHGILHVLGMDHADEAEAAEMQARERALLAEHHRS